VKHYVPVITACAVFIAGCAGPAVHTTSTETTRASITAASQANDAAAVANTQARTKLQQIIYDAKQIKKLRHK
jgi:hypothetical protein